MRKVLFRTKTTVALATGMLSVVACGAGRTDTDGVVGTSQAAQHATPSSPSTQIVPILDNLHPSYDLFVSNNTGYRFTCTDSSGQTDLTGLKHMELSAGFTSSQLASSNTVAVGGIPTASLTDSWVQNLITSSSSGGNPVAYGDLTTLDCHTPQANLVEIDFPTNGTTDRRFFVRLGDLDPSGTAILHNVGCGSLLVGMGLNPANPSVLPVNLNNYDVSDTYDINCHAGSPPPGYQPALVATSPLEPVIRGSLAIEGFTTSEDDLVPTSAQLAVTNTTCKDSSGTPFLTQFSNVTNGQGQWVWQVSGVVPYTFTNQTCTATYVLQYTLAGTPFQTAPATFTLDTGCSVGTVTNCGGCGDVCTAPANATPVCEVGSAGRGICSFNCTYGFASPGVCACPSGESMCSSGCVNTQSDAQNCGACGHSCLQGTCNQGKCTAWDTGASCGGPLDADANYLYWGGVEGKKTTPGSSAFAVTGEIKGYPTTQPGPVLQNGVVAWLGSYAGGDAVYSAVEGSTTSTIGGYLPTGYNRPGTLAGGADAIALNPSGTQAYVVAQENVAPWAFALFQCPLTAGSCVKLSTIFSPPTPLSCCLGEYKLDTLAAGQSSVFFMYDIPNPSSGGSIIRELSRFDLNSRTIVTVSPAPANIYGPLPLDANDIYFIENGIYIYRLPQSFASWSTPALVANYPGGINPQGFSTDGINVYFGTQTNVGAANLFYAPVGGGTPKSLYASAHPTTYDDGVNNYVAYSYITSPAVGGAAIYFRDSDTVLNDNDDGFEPGSCSIMGIAAP